MTEAEALEILKRDDDEMRKGYFCINDFLALEVAKTALEKQIVKAPLLVPTDDTCLYHYYRCPNCEDGLVHKFKPYYCKCGQKLDWSEV